MCWPHLGCMSGDTYVAPAPMPCTARAARAGFNWGSWGGPGGPCPAHLAKVPGGGGDVVAGALVDESLLGQHVLAALVLVSEENRVLCRESERWGWGSAPRPPARLRVPPLPGDVLGSDWG